MMKRILVIDDNKIVYEHIKKIINENSELKYKVEIKRSENGFEGLVEIAQNKPDLIFMDFEMIYLNGYETTAIIKQSDDYRDIPIVFFSGKESPFDKMQGLMLGANDYLHKAQLPIEVIVGTIKRNLGI